LARGLDWDLNAEALEVDNRSENDNCRDKIHDVGQVLAEEGFSESQLFIRPSDYKMHQREDGPLKLWSTPSINSGRAESFPNDLFADIGSDAIIISFISSTPNANLQKRYSRTQSISLLEKLIK
jgi:hypothetical protein